MTAQMQRLLTRVDGITAPIAPVTLIPAVATELAPGGPRRAAAARRRAIRITRQRAGVLSGRVPRTIEALIASETSEFHDDEIHDDELLALGLL